MLTFVASVLPVMRAMTATIVSMVADRKTPITVVAVELAIATNMLKMAPAFRSTRVADASDTVFPMPRATVVPDTPVIATAFEIALPIPIALVAEITTTRENTKRIVTAVDVVEAVVTFFATIRNVDTTEDEPIAMK